MIPSMWRVELLHPLFVHLPLGVLLTATFFRLIGILFLRAGNEKAWPGFTHASSQLFTIVGTLGAWAAYVTGNFAEEEVNSALCDPTLTHQHGDLAFYVTLLFSAVALVDLFSYLTYRSKFSVDGIASILRSRWTRVAVCLVALVGAGLLAWVGHMGASLTYQQGAAVYKPTPECTEFE